MGNIITQQFKLSWVPINPQLPDYSLNNLWEVQNLNYSHLLYYVRRGLPIDIDEVHSHFMRQASIDILNHLNKCLNQHINYRPKENTTDCCAIIGGASGSGKSTVTWAWFLMQNTYRRLWVHRPFQDRIYISYIDPFSDSILALGRDKWTLKEVEQFIKVAKCEIVVFDGYVGSHNDVFIDAIVGMLVCDREKFFGVICANDVHIHVTATVVMNFDEFEVPAISKEEFTTAKAMMCHTNNLPLPTAEWIEKKYQNARGHGAFLFSNINRK